MVFRSFISLKAMPAKKRRSGGFKHGLGVDAACTASCASGPSTLKGLMDYPGHFAKVLMQSPIRREVSDRLAGRLTHCQQSPYGP